MSKPLKLLTIFLIYTAWRQTYNATHCYQDSMHSLLSSENFHQWNRMVVCGTLGCIGNKQQILILCHWYILSITDAHLVSCNVHAIIPVNCLINICVWYLTGWIICINGSHCKWKKRDFIKDQRSNTLRCHELLHNKLPVPLYLAKFPPQ